MLTLRFFCIVLLGCCVGASALAQGPSLKQRILANPQAEIGPAIRILASEGGKYSDRRDAEVAINWCHIYASWHGSRDDDFLEHFEHVARTYVHYRKELQAAGYPTEYVKADVDAIAMAYLGEIQRRRNSGLDLKDISAIKRAVLPFERRLGQRMNAYRQQAGGKLGRPTVWDECGGDYMGFAKLKTQPAGAALRVIREFYYKFCQVSGINPLSSQCDKWSLVTANRDLPGGIYYYHANWPNAPAECDRIEFDGASPTEDDKVVTIKQSGRGCAR